MNNLILMEAEYNGGLFPKIPERMNGQDTLLVSVDGIARKVDDYTTTKDIRKGNYNKVVRISTAPFSLDIKLKAVSKNKPYQFDIVVGVECEIKDSVAYYSNNKAYDIESSINTVLSRKATPIAKTYELTDDAVDGALLEKLADGEYSLKSLGITYTVHSADAEPESEAANFVKQIADATLNTRVERHKVIEAEKLTARDMESAIMRQVTEGKLSMQQALEQLRDSNRKEGYNKLDDIERLVEFVRSLQEKNLITDDEAGQRINEFLSGLPAQLPNSGSAMRMNSQKLLEKSTTQDDEILDDLLPDEEVKV